MALSAALGAALYCQENGYNTFAQEMTTYNQALGYQIPVESINLAFHFLEKGKTCCYMPV